VSELDRFGGGGADHLVMCGGVFDALSFQVGGDGVQDRQQLGTVSGTVQEGGSEVAGHRSVGCVLWYCSRWGGSEIPEHVVHFLSIDGGVIPANAVASLNQVATDLPIGHAAHELLPWSLNACLSVGHTCLSGVVEKLIVSDPQGSIPGFVVCPTVVGSGAHRCRLN